MIPACCGTVGDITDISRMNKHGLPGGVGWLPFCGARDDANHVQESGPTMVLNGALKRSCITTLNLLAPSLLPLVTVVLVVDCGLRCSIARQARD
jgi:hypothetical protein